MVAGRQIIVIPTMFQLLIFKNNKYYYFYRKMVPKLKTKFKTQKYAYEKFIMIFNNFVKKGSFVGRNHKIFLNQPFFI